MAERRITGPTNNPGSVLQATQTALEAETNENTYIPPDLLRHGPGVIKFSARFNVAGTLTSSDNVDSVSDTGTGDWLVNITTDFSGTTSRIIVTRHSAGTPDGNISSGAGTNAAGTQQVLNGDSSNAASDSDVDTMDVIGIGDQ